MLTTADIILGYQNDEWEGFGYLGERRHQDEAAVVEADRVALAAANKAGLDAEQFFYWLNSKNGRWFGDCMFGANGQHAERYVPGQGQF
jgi:hypothetical protein